MRARKLVFFAFSFVILYLAFSPLRPASPSLGGPASLARQGGREPSILHLDTAYASAVSLGVSPPLLKINIVPGKSVEKQIAIENLSTETVALDLLFIPFAQSNENSGQVDFSINQENFFKEDPTIFDKIKILDENQAIKNITLSPQQKKTLTLLIDIPEEEKESDYYFSIVFISKEVENEQNNTRDRIIAKTYVENGITTNVFLSIKSSSYKPEAIIESFSTPFFHKQGPVQFDLTIKNTSKHVSQTTGSLLIKNIFGQAIGKINIPPAYVLANSQRTFLLTWPESFLVGPYTAYLTVAFPENGPVFGRVLYFFGFPAQVLGGIILIIIVILILVSRVKRKLI